ncbi:MAG TPA: flagellar motor switch phosphatase FliY [Bacillaceae bacterium]
MNGDMLSQDEIDALLRGDYEKEAGAGQHDELEVKDYLNDIEQDALGEIGNISFGSSATALSTLLGQKVEITTPAVSIIERSRLEDEFPHPYVAIQVKYTAGFSGMNILVIKQSDAAIIADLMLGGDGTSPAEMMDDIHLSAVQEAMNQMMGSAATSMSSVFNKRVDISPPSIDLLDVSVGEGTDKIPDLDLLVRISFRLKIGSLIDSDIMQVLPVDFAKKMVAELFSQNKEESVPEMKQSNGQHAAPKQENNTELPPSGNAAASQSDISVRANASRPEPKVQAASFTEFSAEPIQKQETKNLDILLDIPLNVTVELGRTRRSVKDILDLGSGSIIELDKLAGEPVDILVNNRLIAKGEVVVIDENFGVRVTDISSQSDRLKKLKY